MKQKLLKSIIFSVLLAGIALVCLIIADSTQAFDLFGKSQAPPEDTRPFTFSTFRDVAKEASPSVVSIKSTKVVERRYYDPFWFFRHGDNPFDWFNNPQPQEKTEKQETTSLGSGFIIDKDGYILTNYHVIADVDEVTVTLQDEKEYDAEIVGKDQRSELALLKIKKLWGDFQPAKLGDSDAMEVGDWVLAIGNPFGLGHTVTAGIISAKGREFPSESAVLDLLQTDAPINPGNSGGPLLNINGEVIGINTMIISTPMAQQSAGLGFAIPINDAKKIIEQLKEKGSVTRGWLGVNIQNWTPALLKAYGLDKPMGALVAEVLNGTPAEKAGIQNGDVIISYDGTDVKSPIHLTKLVGATAVGEKVEMVVIRQVNGKNKEITLKAKIAERNVDETGKTTFNKTEDKTGLHVEELNSQLASQFGVPSDTEGVAVMAVDPLSPAQKAGFSTGDIIVEINREKVTDIDSYRKLLDAAKKADKTILFLINRNGSNRFLAVELKDKD